MTLQDLFKKLSELDPEFDQYGNDVLRRLLVRIHDLGLRIKLEDCSEGWVAIVMSADSPKAVQEQDKQPLTTAVKAYVAWLEKNREVAA
jgi:hypothetical protein